MPRQNKNDAAWQLLFEKYDILKQLQENNYFSISARQINEFREARLMAKFDTKEMLPELFRKHKLRACLNFAFASKSQDFFGSGKAFYCRIAALFYNKKLPTGSKNTDLQRKG